MIESRSSSNWANGRYSNLLACCHCCKGSIMPPNCPCYPCRWGFGVTWLRFNGQHGHVERFWGDVAHLLCWAQSCKCTGDFGVACSNSPTTVNLVIVEGDWLWYDVLSVFRLLFSPLEPMMKSPYPLLNNMIWCSFACEVLGMAVTSIM